MSEPPSELPAELLAQLLTLIDSLRAETASFLDEPGEQQVWYNRGYANGMLTALQGLGQGHRLGDRRIDDADQIESQQALPWGKAYRHGESVGSRETHEITGYPAS